MAGKRGDEASKIDGCAVTGAGRAGCQDLLAGQHAVAAALADADDGVNAVEDAVGDAVALGALAAAGRPAGAAGLGFSNLALAELMSGTVRA